MPHHTPDLIGWYFVQGGSPIKYPTKDIWPSTYLDFARADFDQEKSARSWVNTVSNAKRALHLQVDALAVALGWSHVKGRNDFPTKLNFLGSCGVLSPTIIKRINRFRNSVEHDYYIPSEDEALEYLEIVELYLGATHHTATYFPDWVDAQLISDAEDYDPKMNYPPSIMILLPEGEGKLKITAAQETIVEVVVDESAYFEWVAAIVKQNAT
jgi:hypothetical protein